MNLPFRINRRGKLVNKMFRVWERIGQAIINPRGIGAGKKSVIVGE